MNLLAPEVMPRARHPDSVIDFSRRFVPEQFTPLYHTPAYSRLNADERLRYNQLHGMYFNEQIMFFERALARNVLGRLLSSPIGKSLKAGLNQFMEEESRHSAMFLHLNRQCAPHLYAHDEFYFIRPSPIARKLLHVISRQPRLFPLFLWLMLLEEERALHYGAVFVKSTELEPHFIATQRTHLADETGHVRWDEELLDEVWPGINPLLRGINARLLRWLIAEFFMVPKRAGMKVLDELGCEMPSIRSRIPELRRELAALQSNRSFRASLYPRNVVSKTFARLELWPEFAPLVRLLEN